MNLKGKPNWVGCPPRPLLVGRYLTANFLFAADRKRGKFRDEDAPAKKQRTNSGKAKTTKAAPSGKGQARGGASRTGEKRKR